MTSVSFSPGSGALAGNPLEIDRELLRGGKCLPGSERHKTARSIWEGGSTDTWLQMGL